MLNSLTFFNNDKSVENQSYGKIDVLGLYVQKANFITFGFEIFEKK